MQFSTSDFITMTASSQITLNPALLSDDAFCQDWGLFHSGEHNDFHIDAQIEHYVDGKGLACPMPLLKLKMALKKTALGHAVYVSGMLTKSCDVTLAVRVGCGHIHRMTQRGFF